MDDTQEGGFQSSLTAHERKKVTIRALKMGYQMTNLPDHSKFYLSPLLWVDLDSATRPWILNPRSGGGVYTVD